MNNIRMLIGVLVLLVLVSVPNFCNASQQDVIVASGSYTMDSNLDETPATARGRALESAKRAAVAQAGVYIESYTKVVNLIVEHDEINAVAAQLLKIQDEKCEISVVGENLLKFTVTIKALVNAVDDADMKSILQDKKKLEEMTRRHQELQKEYDSLKAQMDNLKIAYKSADDGERARIKEKINQNGDFFAASEALERGNVSYAKQDYRRAIMEYNEAARLNANYAEIYNNRGLTYYHLHDYAAAERDLSKALDLNVNFSYAYNNRGIVRAAMGKLDAAIDDYTRAIVSNPRYAYAMSNRASIYAQKGDVTKAINDLKKAIEINPTYANAHNNLGNVYLSQARYAEAVQEYTLAIGYDNNYAEAYYNRSLSYMHIGNNEAAIADAKRAYKLAPNDVEVRMLCSELRII